MAITKIHPIKSTLNLAIDYIVNGDKTDEQLLISTHKCHQETFLLFLILLLFDVLYKLCFANFCLLFNALLMVS